MEFVWKMIERIDVEGKEDSEELHFWIFDFLIKKSGSNFHLNRNWRTFI
jgi:hypothetical protein